MTRKKAKKITLLLDKQIDKIVGKYSEKIFMILKNYRDKKIDDLTTIGLVIEEMSTALINIHKTTSETIRKNYKKIEPFKIKNILDLTYKEDNKTLEERVTKYFKEIPNKNKLFEKLCALLDNESKIVKNKVLKHKLGRAGNLLIIECEENDCRLGCSEYAGEYAADENIPLPPYHPSCCCIAYFLETDNEDDIDDLDIEVEEVTIQ